MALTSHRENWYLGYLTRPFLPVRPFWLHGYAVNDISPDTRLRLAAAEHVKRISAGSVLTSDDLRAGFVVDGTRIPLINPQRGIFKPTSMQYVLSVRTVYPATGDASGTTTSGRCTHSLSVGRN